jgi:hypothetical protein
MSIVTYEFVIPSAIFLFDTQEWPSIALQRDGFPMQIQKPVAGQKLVGVAETIGNEGVEVNYSIVRVGVSIGDAQPNPEWYIPFGAVRECLAWIRVASRQYWLGVLMSGTNSFMRGSIITGPGKYTNVAATQTPIGINPLTKELWEWIGLQVAAGNKPSIADLFFCDAMLSFREHDFMQTIIRLGVVCELELNAFLDDLIARQSATVKALYNERKFQFAWKLKNIPPILGADSFEDHDKISTRQITDLYELRGSAIHRAECLIDNSPVKFEHVAKFVFAVERFLSWTKSQRAKLGLSLSPSFSNSIKTISSSTNSGFAR